MHAFRTLAYLDVEKTGSTYVSRFLREFLDEEETHYEKHGMLEPKPPADRIHVISVREPVDTYLSLFSYGCDRRGRVYRLLAEHGRGNLYEPTVEGFARWIDFILDPQNAHLLANRNYARSGVAPFVGLLSFRVARLAMPRPVEMLRRTRSTEEFMAAYRAHSVVDDVLRTEHLTADLEDLVQRYAGTLSWRPGAEAAIEHLHGAKRINTSNRVDREHRFVVPDEVTEQILAREVLLAEEFGYGEAPARLR